MSPPEMTESKILIMTYACIAQVASALPGEREEELEPCPEKDIVEKYKII